MTETTEPSNATTEARLVPPALLMPAIRLHGAVDYGMYASFRSVMDNPPAGEFAVAITTLGGDPEVGRMMGEDVRLHCQTAGNNILFLGRVAVYSAGATFMSYFRRENRWLTHGTRLLIHERQIEKTIGIKGPLRSCIATLKASLAEIEESIRIEEEGFANIVAQSDLTLDEVRERAHHDWYVEAGEALRLGLVAGVV